MAKIPQQVLEIPLSGEGISLRSQGKVRDTYLLPPSSNLLQLATNRISIFDFVLPAVVRDKGAILTAMTVFWLTQILQETRHHLIAYGKAIDEHLPLALRGNPELQKQGLVVRHLQMLPAECVVRGYLTGTGWKAYKNTSAVCEITLPKGLYDGSKLQPPLFTPTTKDEDGHDVHIPVSQFEQEYGQWPGSMSLVIYRKCADYAASKGIILADTKFEFGVDGTLGDEVCTPDSSRFWASDDWARCFTQSKSPPSFDKEPVRKWGKENIVYFGGDVNVPLPDMDPENEVHVAFVHAQILPEQVLSDTTDRYYTIFQRLTGMSLQEFQRDVMKIDG